MSEVTKWATEYQVHEGFDWEQYAKLTKLPIKKMLDGLEVPYAAWYFWRRKKACPAVVWRRCVRLWGDHGMQVLAATKQRAPFRLPLSYAAELGKPIVTTTPDVVVDTTPPPQAAPESVSWELYTNTMNVLMDHSRELLSERQTLQLQVVELQARVTALQSEVAILRQTPTSPVRFTPPSNVTETLQKLAGSSPILSDLETRLGKSLGLH